MHIIRLEAQNIQRLSAVTIKPSTDSPAVVLAGANEEGKSSVLDAIEMALAGERAMPPEPIRRGQDKAHVVVDLGDMIVTRRYTAKGSSLTVTNRDGLRYPSPQSLLDGLYSKLTFDPLAFAHAKPDEQAAILRRLAGLDTTDLDTARKTAFEQRTLVNRDVARVKGALESAPHHEDVGTELEDAGAVLQELAAADRLATAASEAERKHAHAITNRDVADRHVDNAKKALDAARAAVTRAELELKEATQIASDAASIVTSAQQAAQEAAAAIPDRAALREKVADIQSRNQRIETNRRHAELATELETVQKDAADLTARIEALDADKATRLAEAKFPIEGLGLSDSGVTWNGIPFEQASTAIRTRVSASIGFALNPKLRILLVRNGNDLDAKNLKLLAETAAEAGGQVWIERIAGGDGLQTVVIEDGAVQGAPATATDDAATTTTTPPADASIGAPAAAAAPPRRRRAGGLDALPLGGEQS